MTQTADNVRVAVTGAVYFGPTGTTLPTNATTSLNAAFLELGYIDDNGVVQTIDEQTDRIKAWQNGDTVRTVQSSHDVSYAFTALESNDQVLDAFYGNYSNGTVTIRGDEETRGEWVIQVIDGGDLIRIVIPDGKLTDRGDVTYANGSAISYPFTIECYPDTSGNKVYLYYLGAGS